jgi:SAM-dependent methyltransferase
MGAEMIFDYRGTLYPEYLKQGNACQHIAATALQFCRGVGLDVGAGRWPLPGAIPVELRDGGDAMDLPLGEFPYVFSSHCLEHLANPIQALEHWATRIKPGGVLFLYLPHPAMEYWRPQHCRKHLHAWRPEDMAQIVTDLGFADVIHSERDLAWSFSVVGFKGSPRPFCA